MTRSEPCIVLVGLMGTGKTTVARLLAEHRGVELLDTDKLIEARDSRSIREIFAQSGEAVFRELESDVLRECLSRPGSPIIAGAGGVVVREQNRAMLDLARNAGTAVVVWLHARPEVLAERTAKGVHRPLLDNDRMGTLTQMSEDRSPLYASVADIVIDVSDRSVESVVDLLVSALDEQEEFEGNGHE
ncbi:MAG: shikimate kinase [Ilumatobacteraceae bacterium]|nr:shikimate kinase [Ilumatobacteraceae bacterium]